MTGTGINQAEAEIIASILAGDTQRFHDLIRPYEGSVYAVAFTLLKNQADAEEVAQEAFLKAYRALAGFRSEAKFSTWLVSITLNEARNRLRQRKATPVQSLDEPDEEGHISPALLRDWRELPSEVLERSEIRELLQKAITELPPKYREVFLLRDVNEYSVQETADSLAISVANVKVRLHRARMMLQKRLAPELKQFRPKRRWLPW